MKLASEQPGGLVHGLSALSFEIPANKYWPLFKVFLMAVAGAASFQLFAFMLPSSVVPLYQNIACWALVAAIAVLTLLITVKVLEGLLDP